MRYYIVLFLKGMAMGVANIIPGVSGGTIALITNIYEELINSLKNFNLKALNLLFSLHFKKFAEYTNVYFLLSVFSGVLIIMLSIASLLEYLFDHHRYLVWAFFFGLILASVYFVGKKVDNWNKKSYSSLIIGALIAISLSFINQGSENSNLLYVFLCGIIGISGMMLPGLSGSFILILMGNYELLMVQSLTPSGFNLTLLLVFGLGSIFGLLSFSHFLSWILRKFKDITLALLTGFILGSLSITWPWQKPIEWLQDKNGKFILKEGEKIIIKWEKEVPNFNTESIFAILIIALGFLIVYFLENSSKNSK